MKKAIKKSVAAQPRPAKTVTKPGTKTGTKAGTKTGAKTGAKTGTKMGTKMGTKRLAAAPDRAAAPQLANTPASVLPGADAAVMDRLHAVVLERRTADPALSHSARLLSRGAAKVAQKFGEEAVECLIEAVTGNAPALVAESADVLYHLIVMWVAAGVAPDQVWAELCRREGISGITERASRGKPIGETSKIP